jgi:hypothetical protein
MSNCVDENNNFEIEKHSIIKNISYTKELWLKLTESIKTKQLRKFEQLIKRPENGEMGKTLINEILLKCIEHAAVSETPDQNDGVDFIECFMKNMYTQPCYFVCWDCMTCKKIVAKYLAQKRKFSHYSIGFLLRCNDIDLINKYFDSDLAGEQFCSNWHIMFITSYKEKFYTECKDRSREGFMCRFILLCRLRCPLENKRKFLIWFAGLIYLYSDEYFYRIDESHIKTLIPILFDALIINGMLTYNEMKNLFQMLVDRNNHIKNIIKPNRTKSDNIDKNELQNANSEKTIIPDISYLYTIYSAKYPFSLKNLCRIAIKNSMIKYTRANIEQLRLPANLKRFLYYESEIQRTMNEVLNGN